MLLQHERLLNIKALPLAIPNQIELDVKELRVGDTLYVKDLPEIEGLEYLDEQDKSLVHVMVKKIVELEPEKEEEEEKEGEAAAPGEEKPATDKEQKEPSTTEEKKE